MSIKNRILHYLYGIFAQGFNGAIATLAAAVGMASASIFYTDIPKINLHMAEGIFVTAFAWNCVFYFRTNPLPSELPEGGQFKAAIASVIPTKPANT